MKRLFQLFAVIFLAVALAVPAFAQAPLTVDIHGPGQRMVNFVMLPPRPAGESLVPQAPSQGLAELIANDLGYIPFLKDVPSNSLLGGDPSKGVERKDIDFKPLQLAKVDLVMTTGWDGNSVELRVFETFSGRRVIGKKYNDLDRVPLAKVADRFCSVFLEALTGKKGFFESPIAFVKHEGETKEIFTILPQGRELQRITRLGGFNLSPAWSMNGRKIAFTHIGKKTHSLGVYDADTRKITLYTKGLGHSVISPVFGPDDHITVALNRNGATNIYQLDGQFRPRRTLAQGPYIDVSPSFDRTGELMAFTSGRAGNPHIYLMNMKTGQVRRVTIQGKYNTHPCLSPNGRFVAYTHRIDEGHRIFLHDLATGREKQLTFGPGNDEFPAFGPDGYFIAFASNRTGEYKLYLTTRHGDTPRMLPTGKGPAYAPAWDTSRQW